MRKETLSSLETKTYQVKRGDDPQFLCLENSSVNTSLKIEVKKEVGSDVKLFNSINALFLLELQNKIQRYTLGGLMPIFKIDSVANDQGEEVEVVRNAKIDLAFGGEISLSQNDSVNFELKNLGKIADSSLYTFEGTDVAVQPYIVKDKLLRSDEQQKKVDLENTDFLVFDKKSIPSEIEFRVNGQKIIRSSEAILLDQNDKFNVVGFDTGNSPILGTHNAVVIDVRACSEVILEDESEPRQDIKYYTLKTPY